MQKINIKNVYRVNCKNEKPDNKLGKKILEVFFWVKFLLGTVRLQS